MIISRRKLLGTSVALGGLALVPAVIPFNARADRSLTLHVLQTGEQETVTFWSGGDYLEDGLAALNRLLRDFKTDVLGVTDLNLLNALHAMITGHDPKAEIEIVRGYIAEDPKAPFPEGSPDHYHAQGKAVDLRVPGVSLEHLAMDFIRWIDGGAGIYTKKEFVHLDVGHPRRWVG